MNHKGRRGDVRHARPHRSAPAEEAAAAAAPHGPASAAGLVRTPDLRGRRGAGRGGAVSQVHGQRTGRGHNCRGRERLAAPGDSNGVRRLPTVCKLGGGPLLSSSGGATKTPSASTSTASSRTCQSCRGWLKVPNAAAIQRGQAACCCVRARSGRSGRGPSSTTVLRHGLCRHRAAEPLSCTPVAEGCPRSCSSVAAAWAATDLS